MTAAPRTAPRTQLVSIHFVVVTALFVTALIAANVMSVKLVNIAGVEIDAGTIIFPMTYIFGDVLTEVYGYGRARQVIWLGFFCNLLFVLAVVATEHVGGAAGAWSEADQQAFHRILGYTARLLAASFAGYLVGEFINSFVLARLKVATEGRFLWLRTISSTVLGQAVDSAIFAAIAFGGEVPGPVLREIMWHNWVLKTAYEALATPVTYLIVSRLKAIEGVDVFDRETNWSPIVLPL